MGYWLLAIGYWLLVIGYWLLIRGYWLLISGYWLLIIGYWLLASGYWLVATSVCENKGPSKINDVIYKLPLEPPCATVLESERRAVIQMGPFFLHRPCAQNWSFVPTLHSGGFGGSVVACACVGPFFSQTPVTRPEI